MAVNLVPYTAAQALSQCLDLTGPVPRLRTDTIVEVGSAVIGHVILDDSDNNIGNVDLASPIPAGDNNIGNVDVVTLPALPAGPNTIGNVGAPALTSAPYSVINCTTSATPLFSAIDATRKSASVFNRSDTLKLYIGPDASVTVANAPIVIPPLTGIMLERQDGFAKFKWYGIAPSSTIDAGVMEGKE